MDYGTALIHILYKLAGIYQSSLTLSWKGELSLKNNVDYFLISYSTEKKTFPLFGYQYPFVMLFEKASVMSLIYQGQYVSFHKP